METSRRKSRRTSGFTLVETLIAVVILAVGLLGIAALLAKLSGTTTDSRYISTKVTLASEKLEDLARLPTNDIGLAPGGDLANSLVGYSDQVQVSSNGNTGNTANTTIVNDGVDGGAAPVATSDMQIFTRRWVIEANQPVAATAGAVAGTANGVLRITVIVIPQTGTPQERAQNFQASMVRPI